MGRKLNVYLSDEAIEVLDDLVAQRKALWSTSSNRSNTLNDLLLQQGRVYIESLALVREAVDKYVPGHQMQRALAIAAEEAAE